MSVPEKLPRGLWYDGERDRWRVRVYRRNRPIHVSYHKTYVEAVIALAQAKERQHWMRRCDNRPISTVADQVQALKLKLI